MIIFCPEDAKNKRRVILKGRIVTVIDMSGSKVRIAEDGLWYEQNLFFELTDDDKIQEHLGRIKELVAGKSIATLKPNETGIQLVLDDNTRLGVTYSKNEEGITFSVTDSNGNKVL